MIIKDPQALLPHPIPEDWKISGMVLDIPAHGIPLHPSSIQKILAIGKREQKSLAFKPVLPITSEIGLPPYPILAYLYPQAESSDRISVTIISQIDRAEQEHYFGNHYGTAVKPAYVRVIVGNSCNLKCTMCPYHSPLLKPTHTSDFFKDNQTMSWEMMEKLAAECGAAKLPILMGSVEEPLLHPKLVDFIRLCRQQGVPSIHLTTNGQLLDENMGTALLAAGLTSIDISIDAATPETYLKVRGAKLSRVETNISNLLRLRDRLKISCKIRTSFVRNQDVSYEEEQQFREHWLERVDGVFILNLAEYQANNVHLQSTNSNIESSLQYYLTKAQGRWTCLFPFVEMAVLPDGRIYYCIETLFRLGFDRDIESLGDYHQQTLQDIWQGQLFNQLRTDLILDRLDKRTACKDCEMWKSQIINIATKEDLKITTTTVTEIYEKLHS
jgi:MoaA/NifB/PqqE/SkfB family radical SAM enzyme